MSPLRRTGTWCIAQVWFEKRNLDLPPVLGGWGSPICFGIHGVWFIILADLYCGNIIKGHHSFYFVEITNIGSHVNMRERSSHNAAATMEAIINEASQESRA